jgi:ABC-type lipopolysaccharide export system ATPase subunit
MAPTRYTFLDEPFAGLAPLSVDYLHHHLRLAGERKGILLTDQDFSSVTSVAESIYLVGGGTVEPLGPKATPT